MKVLFITSTRIGDAVLSMGLLNHIITKYPSSQITIACGPLVQSFFEDVPNVENVIVLKKEKRHGHWIKLWKKTVMNKWDMVVDLRDSAVSRLIYSKKKFIFSSHIDKNKHKVEQNAQVMRLDNAPNPKLWFSQGQMDKAASLMGDGDNIIGVGPTANWIGKTWPIDNFIEITKWLISEGGLFSGYKVAVFGAPGEEEEAYKLYNSIDDASRIDLIAKGNPAEAAACLSKCEFYLGNDSGLMHCAAASGVKTVGLFGASYPHIYGAWGDNAAIARTPESFDELIDFKGYDPKTLDRTLMGSLKIDDVRFVITNLLT